MSETELVKAQKYAIAKADPKMIGEIIKENAGPGGINPFDLDRVTIPAGGGLQWEVQSLEGVEHHTSLTGVVVYFQDGRAFWRESFERGGGGGSPPDCVSADCITGTGNPGGECAVCPMAQFGSADDHRSQACKQRRNLFLIQQSDLLPTVIQLPVTSYAACRKFFTRLVRRGLPYYGVIVSIALEIAKNQNNIKYSQAVFEVAAQLSTEDVARFKAISAQLRPSLSQIRLNVAEESASKR